FWPAGVGLLLVIGTIFERVRYKDVAPTPPLGPGWVETSERFRDPGTDRWVQVYFKPETGERSYVEIPPPTNCCGRVRYTVVASSFPRKRESRLISSWNPGSPLSRG